MTKLGRIASYIDLGGSYLSCKMVVLLGGVHESLQCLDSPGILGRKLAYSHVFLLTCQVSTCTHVRIAYITSLQKM